MKSITVLLDRLRKGPADVVGLDLGSSAVKAVRLKHIGTEIQLLGAEVLPALADLPGIDQGVATSPTIQLPSRVRSRSVSLAVSGARAIIKLVSFPGAVGPDLIDRLPESMGIKEPDTYRISYRIVTEGHGRTESRVLAVALPDETASLAMGLFASGLPAPYSLEVSGLATLTAFQHGYGETYADAAVGLVEFGSAITTLTIMNRNAAILIRRFDFGSRSLIDRVRESLGVADETARDIVGDSSFDISETATELLTPFISQFVLSRDFVERRENCRIERFHVSGGLATSSDVTKGLARALDVEIADWDPFRGLSLAPQALDETASAARWRFAAATGAALATVEES
jgi:Tfp pilus assembly PilM family ATPase